MTQALLKQQTKVNRTEIIGGSDIAAIMGRSRWRTPLQVWAEKTGRIVGDRLGDFEAAEIGAELEEYVSIKFSRKTGIKLRRDSRTFRHPDHRYMVAHIDRWVVGDDALFEAKTASAWKVKEWADDKVPDEYILQCQWYCGIVGKQKAYIAVLIGGQKFLWKEVHFDKELFDMMVEAARNFKEEFLDKDIMPIAIGGDNDFIEEMWPNSVPGSTVHFEGEKESIINDLIEQRVGGILAIKDARKELDEIEAQLKQAMEDNEVAETGQYVLSWKNQTRESADTKKLKEDGIFDDYKKVSEFRVLRSKKIGGQNV